MRREQVGLYIHKHTQPYTYTPDFSRHRKELSRSREKSEGFTRPRLFSKDSTSIFLSPNYFKSSYPFSPFTYFRVLSGRLQGE